MEAVALPPTTARGKGAGSHGLPGQGRTARAGARPTRPRQDARPDRGRPGRREVVGLALGPRRALHAVAETPWPAPAPPPGARSQAPPDRSAEPRREGADRNTRRGSVLRCWAGALCGRAGRRTDWCASQTVTPRWSDSSISMSHVFAARYICIKVLISTLRRPSGPVSPEYRGLISASPTGQYPIRAFVETNTSTAAST